MSMDNSDNRRKYKRKLEGELLPQQKRSNVQVEDYSIFSQKMMASMGYIPGLGIGKHGSGITQPIDESTHKGRRGLGYLLEGLEKEDVKWELEEVQCDQHPEWMTTCDKPELTLDDFDGWITIDERKLTIDDETAFCDPEILKRILNAKSIFDNLSDKEFLDARTRSNPFETIKGVIFQNRAAMKMANIDAVFDFMFTTPKKEIIGHLDLLYFADLCAGPGGFSEYVLWRKKWHAKGFGMTLKDSKSGSDFKLEEFLAAPCESFDPHYGWGGYEGDGDITNPENIEAFKDYVMMYTEGKGVHFVMADGGISVEGQENIQEILTKQLVLCQYTCALSILRKGGNFVCKVFDMFTPFSVGLFYLLYRCFEKVCLFKPVTSRPANSERYVICENLLHGESAVQAYMSIINQKLIELAGSDEDVLSVVPETLLDEDVTFRTYVTAYNDSFGAIQTTNLKKLQYYVKNVNLWDVRQSDIRRKCLEIWKIPNLPRTTEPEVTHNSIFTSCWKKLQPNIDTKQLNATNFTEVKITSLNFLKDIHSWKWCWAIGKRYMVIGLGRNNIYAWDMKSNNPSFMAKKDLRGLELPKGTVLEIEVVDELQGEGSGQRKQTAAYILDVIAIHNEMVDQKPINERLQYAKKLCKAVNKPCRRTSIMLKTKEVFRVADFERITLELKLKECKGHSLPIPTYSQHEDFFFAPVGIIFFKVTKDPWHIHLSRKEQRFYYYNHKTNGSTYQCPPDSVASFTNTLSSRHFWLWNNAIFNDLCSVFESSADELNRTVFCRHIRKLLESIM